MVAGAIRNSRSAASSLARSESSCGATWRNVMRSLLSRLAASRTTRSARRPLQRSSTAAWPGKAGPWALRREPARAAGPALHEVDKERVNARRVRGDFARERPRLVVIGEEREVGHAHRIENPVEVVALVLQQRRP